MKFPDFITGPRFADGDITTFTFEDAQLTLRLPVVVYNTHSIDEVSPVRDFNGAETSRWEEYMQHRRKELVVQNLTYEDDVTHDNIASLYISASVVAHKDIEERGHYLLSSERLESYWLDALAEEYDAVLAKAVEGPLINGLRVLVDPGDGTQFSVPVAFFSLGRRFSLQIYFDFGSLHYSDRKNPYSDELLHEWKVDLVDDFLSHINIEYTPETVALIGGGNSRLAQ